MWIDLMAGCGGFNNPMWDSFLLYNTFYITYLGLAGDGMRGIDNIGFFGNNSYECILEY